MVVSTTSCPDPPPTSRYAIPRTLPYFANFKSQTISYREYCDIEGSYSKHVKRQNDNQLFSGRRLQIRGHVYESKLEVKERGSARSISVNDLLDQHLSRLTLGGMRSSTAVRTKSRAKVPPKRQDHPRGPVQGDIMEPGRQGDDSERLGDDSGSDDSMLIRQAAEIEKGTINRIRKKKKQRGKAQPAAAGGERKRSPLEPSIVTLVHSAPCVVPTTPRHHHCSTPRSARTCTPRGVSRCSSLLQMEPRETPEVMAEREVLLPDCTTVDSPFVRDQPIADLYSGHPCGSDSPAMREYQRCKHSTTPAPSTGPCGTPAPSTGPCTTPSTGAPILCEKVRHRRPSKDRTSQPSRRVGENPATKSPLTPHYTMATTKCKRKRGRKSSRIHCSDPMKGFGPWIAENDRGSNQTETFINSVFPKIQVDFR